MNRAEQREHSRLRALEAKTIFDEVGTLQETAVRMGITKQAVSFMFKKFGIIIPRHYPRKHSPRRWQTHPFENHPELWQKFIDEYQKVHNVPKVAKSLGLSILACRRAVKMYGIPLPTPAEKYWSRVDRSGGSYNCWHWQYRLLSRSGYGQMHYEGTTRLAHALAWTLTFGPIPKELCVRHKCGIPSCCNPSHLILGTRAQNAQDMALHNRVGRGPHAVQYFD